MGDWFIDDAIRVEISGDYDKVSEFLRWLIEHPEVESFRGGHSGIGNFVGWFPAEHKSVIESFFGGGNG